MLRAVVPTLFPAVCPGCGARGEPLCGSCARTVRPARDVPPPEGLDALVVPFAYAGAVRELIARAKYRQRHAALPWLADAMVHALDGSPFPIEVVTWAPTTSVRRRARGFDQAEVLAVAIAAALGLPCRALLRRVGADHQTGHTRAERIHTPAFRVAPGARLDARSVALVDDVVTTGATLRAAADALRHAGATCVVGVAAARRR